MSSCSLTHIGGPTALIEFSGTRLLTDPTFDPAPSEYTTGPVTLRKLSGPALSPAAVLPIDYVLLSHDHHADNLDPTGRTLLPKAKAVFTTIDGAARLGANSVPLAPWQSVDLPATPSALRVTATPARHGPAHGDRGPVIGFVMALAGAPQESIYFSGDTVWYEGVAEVARRFPIRAAILNLGAARVAVVGPDHLTMTAADAIHTALALPNAAIIPLHFEGWAHFSEGREVIQRAFADASLEHRLIWPEPGRPIPIPL